MQTCIKRSPLGQIKSSHFKIGDLLRGLIHMTFSMTGQGKGVPLIQVTEESSICYIVRNCFFKFISGFYGK
jgi:hypothetical protein